MWKIQKFRKLWKFWMNLSKKNASYCWNLVFCPAYHAFQNRILTWRTPRTRYPALKGCNFKLRPIFGFSLAADLIRDLSPEMVFAFCRILTASSSWRESLSNSTHSEYSLRNSAGSWIFSAIVSQAGYVRHLSHKIFIYKYIL